MALMENLGKKQVTLILHQPLEAIPDALSGFQLELSSDKTRLVYTFHAEREQASIAALLQQLAGHHIDFKDLRTSESSLEDIFVSLVRSRS